METCPVTHSHIGAGVGVVEASASGRRDPLSKAAYGVIRGETNLGELQAAAAIHIDPGRPVDQHVRHTRVGQEWLKWSGTHHIAPKLLVDGQHRRIADRSTGLTQDLRNSMRRQFARRSGQLCSHGGHERRQVGIGDLTGPLQAASRITSRT